MGPTTPADNIQCARRAIEIVCSGDLSRMEEFFSPDFIDHVNDMVFYGYQGGRDSVSFYRRLFKNLRMGVDEQLADGDRVASRWFLNGTYLGRAVTLRGITISRFADDGRIVEDHGHSDSLSLPRQLGVLRTAAVLLEIVTGRIKVPKGALSGNE